MKFRELGQLGDLAINFWIGIAGGVNGVDFADGARPNPFTHAADGIGGVALVTELGDDFVFVRGGHQRPDLVDGVGQRFFTIYVLAAAHGFHRDDGVGVVRCADDHGVDARAHAVEHLAIVGEASRAGIFGEFFGGIIFIDVA